MLESMSAEKEKIVVLGADHNGVLLKKEVKNLLTSKGYACIDLGPHTDAEKVDYVDYAKSLGKIVDSGEARWGILVCGTGVGMSMVANRFPNVRASLVHSPDVAQKSREHNDANVLCLGAWVNSIPANLEIVDTWFGEPFGEGRHVRRVEKTKEHNKEKIVFTNGIFDLIHSGHIQLLRFAKSLGGKLIVAINSDRATKVLKGPERPINNEKERKAIIESFSFVDQVIILDDVKTIGLIGQIRPDVVVKGGEWTADEVRRRDQIPDEIEVKVFPLISNPAAPGVRRSTTGIIENIRTAKKEELA